MHKIEEPHFHFVSKKYDTIIFPPWNLPTTRCIFSAAWCKRSLICDQAIEDIIFLLLFWLSWGGGGVLNLPHSPYLQKYKRHLKNHIDSTNVTSVAILNHELWIKIKSLFLLKILTGKNLFAVIHVIMTNKMKFKDMLYSLMYNCITN